MLLLDALQLSLERALHEAGDRDSMFLERRDGVAHSLNQFLWQLYA
ncbi:MAG: hypothetical protein AAF628_35245 [Planctomycetota bacterium]